MRALNLLISCLTLLTPLKGQEVKSGAGRLEIIPFSSGGIKVSRLIYVWLPSGYDKGVKYSVVYMHDGQMLFDSLSNWNGTEWKADETTASLIAEERIKPCILVGIANRSEYRYAEYMPQKPLGGLNQRRRRDLIKTQMAGEPLGDKYLSLIVKDLKPYIDSHYSTLPDRDNTFIMGSSMGGLISLYAICEYPDIFGGAACLSTHWPMAGVDTLYRTSRLLARSFRAYLRLNLPDHVTHRIYFDHGTDGLDSYYSKHQVRVDEIMKEKGYTPVSWETRVFPGETHSERSWSKRLDIPILFLLRK